jgi:hypothetical protein
VEINIVVGLIVLSTVLGVRLQRNKDPPSRTNVPTPVNEAESVSPTPSTATEMFSLAPTTSSSMFLPTRTATELATEIPTAVSVLDEFMLELPPYSIEAAESNADSPQAKAMEWLNVDTLSSQLPDLYRLNQRYALAVLYYSTQGKSWINSAGWLSNVSECTWYMSDTSCGDASRLSTLALRSNGLQGSMPTELELLTDLVEMHLFDSFALSVAIYSELYVSRRAGNCIHVVLV